MTTARQQQTLDYLDAFIKVRGFSPTYEEIKDFLGLKSKSGVSRIIDALEADGLIIKGDYRHRSLKIADPEIDQLRHRLEKIADLSGASSSSAMTLQVIHNIAIGAS